MKRSNIFKIGLLLFIVPIVFGFFVYDEMPEIMPIHFDANNVPDNFASKNFALFYVHLLMAALYILLYFVTSRDPKTKNQNDKAFGIVILIMPILSIIISYLTVLYVRGKSPDIGGIISKIIFAIFILIGNYLPKIKRNYTMGIKYPWTLDNDYVWEKTHRFGGFVMIIGGVLGLILSIFIENSANIELAIILAIIILPSVYSYIIYRNLSDEK